MKTFHRRRCRPARERYRRSSARRPCRATTNHRSCSVHHPEKSRHPPGLWFHQPRESHLSQNLEAQPRCTRCSKVHPQAILPLRLESNAVSRETSKKNASVFVSFDTSELQSVKFNPPPAFAVAACLQLNFRLLQRERQVLYFEPEQCHGKSRFSEQCRANGVSICARQFAFYTGFLSQRRQLRLNSRARFRSPVSNFNPIRAPSEQ